MNYDNRYSGSSLERIRRIQGTAACQNTFANWMQQNSARALQAASDSNLSFGTLFILKDKIHEHKALEQLDSRNRLALRLCEKMCAAKSEEALPEQINLKSSETRDVLYWMFKTGAADDGIDPRFDHVLDISAGILIKQHHEYAILPDAARVIFARNRRGSFYHDMVWAFFQQREARSLRYIAEYLRSPNPKDNELARMLLHVTENQSGEFSADRHKQHASYMAWLTENEPYLALTGDTFQFTNAPNPCEIDLEAKYIGKPKDSANESEQKLIESFKAVGKEEKELLATYSARLRRSDAQKWNRWMSAPVDKQLELTQYGRRMFV